MQRGLSPPSAALPTPLPPSYEMIESETDDGETSEEAKQERMGEKGAGKGKGQRKQQRAGKGKGQGKKDGHEAQNSAPPDQDSADETDETDLQDNGVQ